MPLAIPPGLKPITQFIRRAEELDRAPEPEASVVAYFCRLYATEQIVKLQDNTPAGKDFLMSMIVRLEDDKKNGADKFSEDQGKKLTTDWAMKKFEAADEEDRAGLADMNTAKSFYAAGAFFDVLRLFGETGEENDRRRLYCKWKASQIIKDIKEGRTPTPGGAGENVVTGMPPVGGNGGDRAEAAAAASPSGVPSLSGGIGEGAGESKHDDPLAGIVPEAPGDNPFLNPAATNEATTAQHDASAPPASSPSPYARPGPPARAPVPTPAPAPAPVPAPAPSPYAAPLAPDPTPYVAPYVAPVAPAPAPAPAPVPVPVPAPAPATTPVPSAPASRRSGSGRAMEGNMADAMEHCRFAIRALEKKNVDLAVQKLHEALQQLT